MIREVPHDSPDYRKTVELRRAVLRLPLGLDFTEEELAAESTDIHLAFFEDTPVRTLLACLVLVPTDHGDVKMRQVAVRQDLQGRGFGTLLVKGSEDLAKIRGFQRMILHARETAVPFYLRLGYDVVGEPFEEVTIPHFRMEKAL